MNLDNSILKNVQSDMIQQNGEQTSNLTDQQSKQQESTQQVLFHKNQLKNAYYQQMEIDPGQDHRLTQYIDVAIGDIKQFIDKIFGQSYKPKNDFSFTQKQKIMKYIYAKNKQMAEDRFKPIRTNKEQFLDDFSEIGMKIQEKRQNLEETQKIQYYNRINFVNEVAKCQNKTRLTGFFWGAAATSIVWATVMRKQNLTRRFAAFLLLFHIGGQYASFRSIDRVFDNCYLLFDRDVDEFLKKEDKRIKEGNAGRVKYDQVDQIITSKVMHFNKQNRNILNPQEDDNE